MYIAGQWLKKIISSNWDNAWIVVTHKVTGAEGCYCGSCIMLVLLRDSVISITLEREKQIEQNVGSVERVPEVPLL